MIQDLKKLAKIADLVMNLRSNRSEVVCQTTPGTNFAKNSEKNNCGRVLPC